MGWKKFTKSAKKTANKATKDVSDTGKKAVDDAKKVADDAAKAAADEAEKAAKVAEKAAKDTYDSAVSEMNQVIGTSLDWFEKSANGFSDAAEKLAADAQKELNRIGDLAQAILDQIFLAALEALVDQIFDDFEEFIDESFDILEDFAKDTAAAAQLAKQLGGIVSTKDLTNALKEAFVNGTRPFPGYLAHAVLSDVTGFKSVSYGVFGSIAGAGRGLGADGGLAAASGQLSEAYALKRKPTEVDMALFAGYAVSTGTSDGVGGGLEIASWRDKPSNLAGKFVGVSITVESILGGAIQFFFANDLSKFLGINLALSASPDGGVEFDVFTGETVTYLF
ncbi:MAG TPA: hypothetical protein VK034_30040 [Enhygromyxa sp.]|nr:hypothetical protein [Enhygromyxa sp.]